MDFISAKIQIISLQFKFRFTIYNINFIYKKMQKNATKSIHTYFIYDGWFLPVARPLFNSCANEISSPVAQSHIIVTQYSES